MDRDDVSRSKTTSKRNKRKGKKGPDTDLNEDELLDQFINENRAIAATSSNVEENTGDILRVDCRQLDPEVEIRSIMEKNMSLCGGASKKIVKQQRNMRTIGRVIKMKAGWSPIKNTGLSMDVFEIKNGISWFRIQHAEGYRNQQYLFTTLRRNHDYESIVEVILAENPYHLESLLLLAQYYILNEEPNRASDSIERALFAIENASHKFNLLLSEHQLDYNWRDNRVLFNLLWHQIQILAGRNCFSTAFQYAKILYGKNMDEDPLATTLLLDMLALRSRNYQFLVDFYEQFESKRNLDMLPNYLYSTAYAHAFLFEKNGNEHHLLKSRELIYKAYIRFPFVLSQILHQLSIDASKESLFQVQAFERETIGVQLLVKIYLHHSLSFWKQPERLAWLESTSTEFVSGLAASNRKEAKLWAERRLNLFVGLPLNIKRHVILCGMNIDDGEIHDVFDPYPPPNTQASYWPDKKLEDEIRQLSFNSERNATSNVDESGVVHTVINHAWQFFRTMWPQVENTNEQERWQQIELNPDDDDNQIFDSQQEDTTTANEQVATQTGNNQIPETTAALNPRIEEAHNETTNIVGSNTQEELGPGP